MTLLLIHSAGLVAILFYIWGVMTLYITSYGIPQLMSLSFADRVIYALKWPLTPLVTVTVFAVMAWAFIQAVVKGEKKPTVKPPAGGVPVTPKNGEVRYQ